MKDQILQWHNKDLKIKTVKIKKKEYKVGLFDQR